MVVGCHQKGSLVPLGVAAEDVDDLHLVCRVQITGRLIRQNDGGAVTSARQIAARCSSPCDVWPTKRRSLSPIPMLAARSRARCLTSPVSLRPGLIL